MPIGVPGEMDPWFREMIASRDREIARRHLTLARVDALLAAAKMLQQRRDAIDAELGAVIREAEALLKADA